VSPAFVVVVTVVVGGFVEKTAVRIRVRRWTVL
jgi:hypothetical protein